LYGGDIDPFNATHMDVIDRKNTILADTIKLKVIAETE